MPYKGQKISDQPFPSAWTGDWVDPIGRRLTIEYRGQELQMSLTSGVACTPYPVPGRPGIVTANLPVRFGKVHDFFRLELPSEAFGLGTTLVWDIYTDEAGELRFARSNDPGCDVWMRPRVIEGILPGESPIAYSWAYPLQYYRKIVLPAD